MARGDLVGLVENGVDIEVEAVKRPWAAIFNWISSQDSDELVRGGSG